MGTAKRTVEELQQFAGAHAFQGFAQVLNYGQSVFEGMKAQRSARGRIVLFRPVENAARMRAGAAQRSCSL